MLRVDFVTLFPEMVLPALRHSILGRAERGGLVTFGASNPRDFATDAHRTVDGKPCGGGPGMVMRPDVVSAAIESLSVAPESHRNLGQGEVHETASAKGGLGDDVVGGDADREKTERLGPAGRQRYWAAGRRAEIILTDPTGERFDQTVARELAEAEHLIFVCGHYEGIDDRIRQRYATRVLSLGDFVLTGGELPAMVMADAVVRLLPGVLGDPASLEEDSHASDGLLGYPQFTLPRDWDGLVAPEVLFTGDHGEIAKWRRKQSLVQTRERRPDLFCRARLTKADLDLLQ